MRLGRFFSGFRRGALVLPRPVARQGVLNWPKCALCMRAVDGYELVDETDVGVEIAAWCSGIRVDPDSGRAVHGAPKVHEYRKDSVRIAKGPGWTAQRFTDAVSRLAFFAPDGARDLQQTIGAEGVRER